MPTPHAMTSGDAPTRRGSRAATPRRTRTSAVAATVLALLAVLVAPPWVGSPAGAAVRDGVDIVLGPDGLLEGEPVMIVRDGDVVWLNDSGGPLTITSPDGVLDSGPVPDRGAYVAALDLPGTYRWSSEVADGVVVVEADLAGPFDAPAVDHVPDLVFPPRAPDGVLAHPDTTTLVSRTRILVGLADDATVGEARLALARAGVAVVGGLPRLGILLVDRGSSFAITQEAVSRLRDDPAVAFASLEFLERDAALPAPSTLTGPPFEWTWESRVAEPLGRGTNWHLEQVRAPAAWNGNEAVAARGDTPVDVAVVDSGFEPHEDLSRVERLELCRPGFVTNGLDVALENCTLDVVSDHGNHVVGIIGADHDNRTSAGTSTGVSGVDPFARPLAVTRRWDVLPSVESDDEDAERRSASVVQVYEELLARAESGTGDLRVINHSTTLAWGGAAAWVERHGGATCGPGPDDDATGTGPCMPHTHDGTIALHADYGRMMRRVVERFVERLDDPPLFVTAGGNDSNDLCVPLTQTCSIDAREPIPATAMASLAWASANWSGAVGQNPIVVVDALGDFSVGEGGPSLERSPFSNLGGDVSAPGWALSTGSSQTPPGRTGPGCDSGAPDEYCFLNGTSMAAPVVSGTASLLLAHDPSLTTAQLKGLLLDWTLADTSGGAAPRLDAYAPLLSLPGVARSLADLNDPSPDGNRRVLRAADGTTTLDLVSSADPDRATDPDGQVDMRDFRRLRDAWLVHCQLVGEDGCPGAIALDGPVDHPKRDLNLDGCDGWYAPETAQACPSETVWNRFDLNGDGVVSRSRTAMVGIRDDGAPAQGPVDAATMTDLQVLASQWDTGTSGAEGVLPDELDELLVSGDVELHLVGLEATGASVAEVEVVAADDPDGSLLATRTVLLDGQAQVFTVPADTPVAFRVGAEGADASLTVETPALQLAAGQDVRLDACGSLLLDLDASVVPDDGSIGVEVVAQTCGVSPEGVQVQLAVESDVAGIATVDPAVVTTDATGRATTTLSANGLDGLATLVASAEVPTAADGSEVAPRSARRTVRVGSAYDLEPLALDGIGSLWDLADPDALGAGVVRPVGPSVNSSGDIAFTGRRAGIDHDELYVVPGDALPDPVLPTDALRLGGDGLPTGARAGSAATLNDAGAAVVVWDRSVGPDLLSEAWRYRPADADQLVTATTATGAGASTYELLDAPTLDGGGRAVLRATRAADGADVLLEATASGLVEGEVAPFARPRAAEDGTVVTLAASNEGRTTSSGLPLLETLVLVGDGAHGAGRRVVARTGATEPWVSIDDVAISDRGDVVAFTGDRGDGPGLHVALRGASGWTDPVEVVGGNATAPSPELGTNPDGTPRHLVDVGGQPGLVQLPAAPAGPAGDRLVLVFEGEPNSGAGGAAAAPGAWSVAATVVTGPDAAGGPTLAVDRPASIVDLGAPLAGSTVADLVLHDAIAADPAGTAVDAHHVAIGVELADGRLGVVRAVWQGPPRADGALAASTTTAATTSSTPLRAAAAGTVVAAPPTDGAGDAIVLAAAAEPDDQPHVAALVVSSVDLAVGDEYVVTNRSRRLDGTPAEAVLGTTLLSPDGSTTRTVDVPAQGLVWLQLATPVAQVAIISDVLLLISVSAGPNRAPLADAGGPYRTSGELPLRLDPRGSTDPENNQLSSAWDLDGDGTFERPGPGGLDPLDLPAADVVAEICGGSCIEGDEHVLGLQVSDGEFTSTATATVTITGPQGLDLLVSPQRARIEPGTDGTVWLTLTPVNGFPGPVDLSVEGAPEGWLVFHQPTAVVPSYAGFQIRVPAGEADDQTFTFDLVVRAGDLEERVPVTVVTAFGLFEKYSARLSGTVTDDAGDPLGGLNVRTALGNVFVPADGDGSWTLDLTLPPGSEAELLDVEANLLGYAPFSEQVLLERDDDLVVDVVLERYERGAVRARAVEGRFNPLGSPIPLDVPLEGVTFSIDGVQEPLVSTADGVVVSPEEITVLDPSVPRLVQVQAEAEGYWGGQTSGLVRAGELLDVGDVALLQRCSATLDDVTVVDQFGEPVSDVRVTASATGFRASVTTDAAGVATFDAEVPLGSYNSQVNVQLYAPRPSGWEAGEPANDFLPLRVCDGSGSATLVLERTEAVLPTRATATGTVVDRETGEPIEGANVQVETRDLFRSWGQRRGATTDAQGRWTIDDVYVPAGSSTAQARARVSDPTRWTVVREFGVETDTTTTVDVSLLRVRTGSVTGVVREIGTGDPVAGMPVQASSGLAVESTITDADGRYVLEDLPARPNSNDPRGYLLKARGTFDADLEPLHWPASGGVIVRADETTVADVDVLPVCAYGTIRGVVRNASSATLEPLPDVTVRIGNSDLRTQTDVDGRYVIEGVPVGPDNGSNDVVVTAEKTDFFSASIGATVFCGADITLDFGSTRGTGVVTGTVTTPDGTPVEGAFVGSGWGEDDTTAADGTYSLEQAPLGVGDAPRDWAVTARHRREQQQELVTVTADSPAVQDFVVGDGNQAPVAEDQQVTATAGRRVLVLLTASDTDGDPLSFSVDGPPDRGQILRDPGSALLEYVPADDQPGTATLTFTADDGLATSAPATVEITLVEGPPDDGGSGDPPDDGGGDDPPADGEPPTAVIAELPVTTEGSTVVLDGQGSSDPEGGELTFAWTLGDGRTFDGSTVQFDVDDDLVTTVTLTVTDPDGASASATRPLEVVNVAPSVALDGVRVADGPVFAPDVGAQPVPVDARVGDVVRLSGTFVDPGDLDVHDVTIDWGDGPTATEQLDVGSRTFVASHLVEEHGDRTVTVTVCDADGGCGDRAFLLRAHAVLPPDGGDPDPDEPNPGPTTEPDPTPDPTTDPSPEPAPTTDPDTPEEEVAGEVLERDDPESVDPVAGTIVSTGAPGTVLLALALALLALGGAVVGLDRRRARRRL